MANPDATDVGVDPLNTQFADLNMSAPAGGTPVADTDTSSFWPAQDTSFSYPTQTDFSAVNHPQPPTDAGFDPQFGGYAAQYADANTGAQQAYWSPLSAADAQIAAYTAQAGPSSATVTAEKRFKCGDCGKAYRLQCELEYVHRPRSNLPPGVLPSTFPCVSLS